MFHTMPLVLAARLGARFGQARDRDQVKVEITGRDGVTRVMDVAPLKVDEVPQGWYL